MKSNNSLIESLRSGFAAISILLIIAISVVIYIYVLGNPGNFQGNDPNNHPLPDNYLGIVYKGGIIVPMLISLLLMTLTFGLERMITISRAKGRGNIGRFVREIRSLIADGNVKSALEECDRQRGSVGNVVKAGLAKYKEMEKTYSLDSERKVLAIQKDIEETTQLEMPMLEKNLVIIATIASIATLLGLLGTVLGMIKAFAALAAAGAPDAVALANGISEALINTALGIGTSAIAIIFYNFFTSKIDELTYSIDEAGFTIVQNFAAKNPERVTA